MNQNVTFLVNSCDKYEDAWHPFFECLWHFAGDIPYPIILNTETKQYADQHYNLCCINSETRRPLTWSKRLLHVLEYIQTDFVFFLLEDYFLKDTFDWNRFQKVIDFIGTHPDVCMVDIRPRWASNLEEKIKNQTEFSNVGDSFRERDSKEFNITCSPGIWRTDALRSLLRAHEDVWDFEIYVGLRAKKYGWKVIRFDTRTPGIYEYDYQIWTGMGITAGHWLPENKPFFDNLGIAVNYDRLGIINAREVGEIRQIARRAPILMLKKIPRIIRKRLTKGKSLK